MKEAYLTIDDSPTKHTSDFVDWLSARDIPAILFCVGSSYEDLGIPCEGIEQNPEPIRKAIDHGYLIGNHTYNHVRFSETPIEEMKEQILKTERVIDRLYKEAGRSRSHKVFRFRDIDRGCGTWVVDFNQTDAYTPVIQDLFWKGVNLNPITPTAQDFEKKEQFQEFLKSEGFSADLYKDINFDWYQNTEMAEALDSLYTYSTSDWMINPDFKEFSKDWLYNSEAALKKKIEEDEWLGYEGSANIILAHDHNNLFEHTIALIEHIVTKQGIKFREY